MAFNLSKNNDPVPVKKNNVWIVVLLALGVVGVGSWYFLHKKAAEPIDTAIAAQVVGTTVTTSGTTVTPASEVPHRVAASFTKGTSAPISISDEVVNEIKKSHKITIYGYASSEGDITVNTKLSRDRAESFKQYLISEGVDAGIITVIGKGIDNPIASNNTESGRTKNRRVEVSIE